MKALMLEEVVSVVEGTMDRPVTGGSISRVATDSRAVGPGDLFFAIRGERFDGHDFVGAAFSAGAIAAVVRSDFDSLALAASRARDGNGSAGPGLIRVDDPVAALGRLAKYYRRSVLGRSATVIAVTGSNGKTTTKAMIAHVLAERWQGKASIKSYNNAVGVPVTLLGVEPSDAFVVCEVGTNAPGEIAALARLIEPDVAVITGISEAHLEGLGSLEKIAEEKLSLVRHLRPHGCAVVNDDCPLLREALRHDRELRQVKRIGFGQWKEAELRLTDVRVRRVAPADGPAGVGVDFVVNDRFGYRLNVPGRHNVFNALAAIGVARRFGMDDAQIAERLACFCLPEMRLQFERAGMLTLINDAYNANPASLAAAVDVLVEASAAGRRVLVVGDMRELGAESVRLHREAAERIARAGVDLVVAVGDNARLMSKTIKSASGGRIETHAYASAGLARRRMMSHLKAGDLVLFKASRLVKLEQLVDAARSWSAAPRRGRRAAGSAVPAGANV